MTSGRASKIIRRTPIGQVTLSSSKPSSRRVLNVILSTFSYRVRRSHTPLQDPLYGSSAIWSGKIADSYLTRIFEVSDVQYALEHILPFPFSTEI